jgi:hypothetical protein
MSLKGECIMSEENKMSEQEINAWTLLCALVVNRHKIDFKQLHEDMDWFRNIICDVEDDTEPPS